MLFSACLATAARASRWLFTVACTATCTFCLAQTAPEPNPTRLDRVTVIGTRPSSLPTEIPTTLMSLTGADIAQTINAVDAEDALKYLPSLNVRKRYLGDHDHAVLATRASGTGNSARSLVFADGVLLSNLLGNGATYTPRWGLVTPEEIERVDVLYGPFSAAYSGNSAGAVVDYITRMPTRFEAHAKLQAFSQNFKQYASDAHYRGSAVSLSLGDRADRASWWFNLNHLDSQGQPIAFAVKLASVGVTSTAGTPVTGAVPNLNPKNEPWFVVGETNQTHTVQDHAKFKFALELTPSLRATYSLGWWRNQVTRSAGTYLTDAGGTAVWAGDVNIGGRKYTLAPNDFSLSQGALEHLAHGFSLKSNTGGRWDWEAAASVYDYSQDEVRTPLNALPGASTGGKGRLTNLSGTGWNTLALKGIWRTDGSDRPGGSGEGEDANGDHAGHTVEVGLQRDAFKLRTLVSDTADWLHSTSGDRFSAFNGNTTLTSFWAQDAWRMHPQWKAVLGARAEHWRAYNGSIADNSANAAKALGERAQTHLSPKAALSFAATPIWTLQASVGRAVRMPTVAELYQGSIAANALVNNDPNLKPEKSWTTEWTAQRSFEAGASSGHVRATLFHERTADALYSQTNVSVTPNVTNIQNIDAVRTTGLEMALQWTDVATKGLDINSSLTFADSKITRNDKFPASVGMWQPRVPRWRANLLVSHKPSELWSVSGGMRFSGKQYGTLDNTDPNGATYTGVSNFLVADVRATYRITKAWSLAGGIDNLNNARYWAFHPYPQRTLYAELRFDL